MAFKAGRGKLIVQSIAPPDKTKGGIFIPDTAKKSVERGLRAMILSVGESRWEDGAYIPSSYSVGQTILYNEYAGTRFEVEGKEFLVLFESDVLALFV